MGKAVSLMCVGLLLGWLYYEFISLRSSHARSGKDYHPIENIDIGFCVLPYVCITIFEGFAVEANERILLLGFGIHNILSHKAVIFIYS